MARAIVVSGSLGADDQVTVSTKVPGRLASIAVDLGSRVEVAGLRYTPRQGADGVTGRIRHYRVYMGERLVVDISS